jgi:hypothetical protein
MNITDRRIPPRPKLRFSPGVDRPEVVSASRVTAGYVSTGGAFLVPRIARFIKGQV